MISIFLFYYLFCCKTNHPSSFTFEPKIVFCLAPHCVSYTLGEKMQVQIYSTGVKQQSSLWSHVRCSSGATFFSRSVSTFATIMGNTGVTRLLSSPLCSTCAVSKSTTRLMSKAAFEISNEIEIKFDLSWLVLYSLF